MISVRKTKKKSKEPLRLLIVFDGEAWHIRRVDSIVHDLERDRKVYYCDEPLGNDFPTLGAAAKATEEIFRRDRLERRRVQHARRTK